MSNAYRIGPDVRLPVATAIWVLSAHLYAILVPLLLMLAVHQHWDALQGLVAYPALFYVAAGIMMAGSAFEVSQNALDHWYLTPETGSANGTGFCDFMFFWFIVASQALVAAACAGDQLWVLLVAMLLVLIFPVLYMRQTLQFLPLAILGTLAALVAFVRLGDPIVFLQLILSPLTMFFFGYLLQTGNQVLHG